MDYKVFGFNESDMPNSDLHAELKSAKKQIEKNKLLLQESKNRYILATEASKDIILDFDLKTGKIYISSKIQNLLGISPDSIDTIYDIWKFIHKNDVKPLLKKFYRQSKIANEWQYEFRVVSSSGSVKWILCNMRILKDSDNKLKRIAGSLTDMTDLELYKKSVKNMAHIDSLTGLFNRSKYFNSISKKLLQMKKDNSGNIAIFLLDMDNFKNINGIYGHQSGDTILKQAAERLINSSKRNETIFRLGGDEFVIIINDYKSTPAVEKRAQDFISILNIPFKVDSKEFAISSSFGIVLVESFDSDPNEILKNADIAMYAAKKNGKNTYCFFKPSMYEKSIKKRLIEEELADAIKNDEFFLMYQPKINIKLDCVEGFEALIRWKHPIKGVISPSTFIPIAEECGLIREIEFWVLENIMKNIADWKSRGIDMGRISINISPCQLKDQKFMDYAGKLIERHSIKKHNIIVEITENTFIDSFETAIENVLKLKQLGFEIALDDFGKGYSSLSYLKRLPIDILKIDKLFIDDIISSGCELVDLIISIAHRLNLLIVAEGVETAYQYNYLKKHSCDIIQGYYISKPVHIDSAEKFMLNFHT